jgi:hypothetical protein
MLGLSWIKYVAIAALLMTISGVIYAGYSYVGNLQSEVIRLTFDISTLESNILQLTQGIAEQQDTIASLIQDIELQANIIRDTNTQFQIARGQVDALRDRLSDHELGSLAYQKPKLVENIVNNATKNVGRCFEIATGSPLTEAEKSATLTSQTNNECPELANPNRKGK